MKRNFWIEYKTKGKSENKKWTTWRNSEREEWDGATVFPILFNVLIEEIIFESFVGSWGVCMDGRNIKCIRLVENMIIIGQIE